MRLAGFSLWVFCCGWLAACAEGHLQPPGTELGPSTPPAAGGQGGSGAGAPADFVRRQGATLVMGESAPYRFRGVTFSSNYYGATRDSILLSKDHAPEDFARVASLGMNVVQLILSYRLFEDDATPFVYQERGWAWLDDNVEQAKQRGLRVIFDLLTVAGGDWHATTDPDPDLRIWTDAQLRRRYLELWRAIATRYATEPAVAAFSLMNEPVTSDADGSAWWSLAGEAIAAIRSVDTQHLIIVNPLAGVSGQYGVPSAVNQRVLFDDPNVLYDLHFYEPGDYVNQGAPWIANAPPDGAKYPDDTQITASGSLTYVSGDTNNPPLPAGTSDWQYLEGARYSLTDGQSVVAYPAVQCSNMTEDATAYFDDFAVREYDVAGALLRVVGQSSVTVDNSNAWYPWSSDGQGVLALAAGEGHADPYAVSISGNSANALFSTRTLLFMVTQGHSYQISGWAKGTGLAPTTSCRFTLGFYAPGPDGSVMGRGRALLDDLLGKRLAFGREHGVPMAVTEFGLMRSCFDDDRGGLEWLKDMVSLLDQHQTGYVFFTYHSVYMGIYGDENQWPNPNIEITAISDFFRGLPRP